MPRHILQAFSSVLLPIAGIAGAVLLVEFAKRTGHLPATVPFPSQIWDALAANPRGIALAFTETTTNAIGGYLLAAIAASIAACIATLIRPLHRPIYNISIAFASIPLIATTPLLALWLGNGPITRSLIAAMASYFPILVGAIHGFRAYEERHMELFHVYSASRWRVFHSLILPTSLPYLFAGLKLAAPLAVLGSLTAELTGAENGIGVLMLAALFQFDVKTVWLTVLISCTLAALGYALWALVERAVIYWDTPAELAN